MRTTKLLRRMVISKKMAVIVGLADFYASRIGVDTADGLFSTPVFSLNKLVSLRGPNKVLAARRGDVFPATATAAVTGTTANSVILRNYDEGARPLLDGFLPISSWTPYTTVLTNPNLVINGNCENFDVNSRNTFPTGWRVFSAGSSFMYKDTSVKRSGSSSWKWLISNGSCNADVYSIQYTPANVELTWSWWSLTDAKGGSYTWSLQRGDGLWLQADSSWAANRYQGTVTPTTTWSQTTVKATSTMTTRYIFNYNRLGSTNGTFWLDDISAYPATPNPVSSNTYRTTWPPNGYSGSNSPGILIELGSAKKRSDAEDINRLGDGEYLYSSGQIYMRKDAGYPLATLGSYYDTALSTNATGVKLSGLDCTGLRQYAVIAYSSPFVLEDMHAQYIGDQDTANGALNISNVAGAVVRRVTLRDINTDAFYLFNATNTLMEDVAAYTAFGKAGDSLQADFDNDTSRTSSRLTMRRFTFDQRASKSPKGCLLSFGDYNVFEDGDCSGGHFGIQDVGSYGRTSRCYLHHIDGYGWGTAGNGESTTDNLLENSISVLNDYGARQWTGTHTLFAINSSTITGNSLSSVKTDYTGITGGVTNSICWEPTRTGPVIEVAGAPTGFTLRNSIIGPEISGTPLIRWNGTNYETLAAFTAAYPARAVNCSTADPKFTGGGSETRPWDAYQLASNSPALTMSTTGGRIGADPTLLAAGQAAVPGETSNAVPRQTLGLRLDGGLDATVQNLAWRRTPGATSYRVETKMSASSSWATVATTTDRWITVTGLTDGVTYDYRVVPLNGTGDGTASATLTASPTPFGTFRDPFTGVNNATPAGWLQPNSSQGTNVFGIQGNQLSFKSAFSTTATWYYFAPNQPGDNQYVQAAVTAIATGTANLVHPQVIARASQDSNSQINAYVTRYLPSTGQWQLQRIVAGSATTLATVTASAPTLPYTLRLEATGPATAVILRVKVNGSEIISLTDTAGIATGNAGISARYGGAAGDRNWRMDDYEHGILNN